MSNGEVKPPSGDCPPCPAPEKKPVILGTELNLGMGMMRLHFDRSLQTQTLDVVAFVRYPHQDRIGIPKELTFDVVDIDVVSSAWGRERPTTIMRLPYEYGDEIMEELWNMGYRPKSGKDRTGIEREMREHIATLKNEVAWLRLQLDSGGKAGDPVETTTLTRGDTPYPPRRMPSAPPPATE